MRFGFPAPTMLRLRTIAEDIQIKCSADSLQFSPAFGAGQDVFDALTRQIDRVDPGYRS